jgi:hypothetical protein
MNNKFDELAKNLAQSVTRRAALKKFSLGLAGVAMVVWLVLPCAAADPKTGTSTVFDAAEDAVFPFDLYRAPVPPYLDIVRASVSSLRGVLHFEIQMNGEIPANADPGFSPSVNHLGPTFGLLTDPTTAESPIHFFGHHDHYAFNYYLGALYSVADSGAGLGLGWHGFLIDLSTFTAVEVPLQIKKGTLILEINAVSLGNPASIDWVVASECDPVPITEEKTKGALLVDFVPEHGYATLSVH